MLVNFKIVFESSQIVLWRKIKEGAPWQSFKVIFKSPPNRRFSLGWNGSRFALGSEYDKFKHLSPKSFNDVELFIRKNHSYDLNEYEPVSVAQHCIEATLGQFIDIFKIESEWLYENRESIPWHLLVGAEVLTRTGQRNLIKVVEDRPWPTGPLITVQVNEDSRSRNERYNIQAFKNRYFKSLVPTAQQAPTLCAVIDQIETNRIAKERVECERQAALLIVQEQAEIHEARVDAKRKLHLEEIVLQNAQEAQALDASRQFDLLIFDLDDTLLETGHLDAFRGQKFIGTQGALYKNELAMRAQSLKCLVPEELLLSLQNDFPSMVFSVFTRAPRDYAAILLETKFPRVKWNSVVTFQDVIRTKPKPDGIFLALEKAGVKSLNRVALVGDGSTDVLSAYQAGIQAVLLTVGWGINWSSRSNPNRTDHYKTLNFMPDAKIANSQDLFNLLTKPVSLLPCLEAWDADPAFTQTFESMRVDIHKQFNNLSDAGSLNWVEIHAMGRYFPTSTSQGWYDFSNREHNHLATKAILEAKTGVPYPVSWAECCANYINGYAHKVFRNNLPLMVCSIPSSLGSIRPLGKDRLKDFLKAIEIQLKDRCHANFNCEILQYAPGANSNKTLNRDARFANVRDHLLVADPSAVQGMTVLVIDDVSTSGATFFYASRYLMQAGAYSVRCLALAQTIS